MVAKLRLDTIAHSGGTNAMTISSSGVISQPTLPIFHVTKSADQSSIADATATLLTFDSITDGSNGGRTINQGGLWASNKLTVTASTIGYYWVYTSIYWETSQNVTAECYGYWKKNGSDIQQYCYTNKTKNTSGMLNSHQVIHLGTAGDYIEFYIYFDNQSSGTTNINQNSVTAQRTNVGGWKIG